MFVSPGSLFDGMPCRKRLELLNWKYKMYLKMYAIALNSLARVAEGKLDLFFYFFTCNCGTLRYNYLIRSVLCSDKHTPQ